MTSRPFWIEMKKGKRVAAAEDELFEQRIVLQQASLRRILLSNGPGLNVMEVKN